MCYNARMISYETFTQYLLSGQVAKLHFLYDSKEYIIAREEVDGVPVFAFASDTHEAVRFPSVNALLRYAIIGGRSLQEVWYRIVPLCNDSLLDDDYIKVHYGESLGRITSSASGTAALHARYATKYLVPSVIVGVLLVIVLLLLTLFVKEFSWTFFGVGTGIVAAAFVIAQFIFLSNTRRYRYGNPEAHLYLLEQGAVIKTSRHEYAIPYLKVIRLENEAELKIVTMMNMFDFIADSDKDIAGTLAANVGEARDEKRNSRKKNKKADQSSSAS